jgi:hypothetical protein
MTTFNAGDQMAEYERLDTPAPEGDVVAWRFRSKDGYGDWSHSSDEPTYLDSRAYDVQPLYASSVVPVGREEIAAMAWRFRGNDRLGGPFYEGAKPTDSPAMADCFAFADAILAALGTKGADHD